MIPVRLELQNFLAYRSPQPIVLDGVHLACLTGANGAGKSSLLDAITWALWGKARTRRDNDLVHLGTGEMYVQLDFIHEGQKYRVIPAAQQARQQRNRPAGPVQLQRCGRTHGNSRKHHDRHAKPHYRPAPPGLRDVC